MLSALKKITTSSGGKSEENGALRSGLQAMPQTLQKKFSKGIQYNMKIVIKGDRNVGKTCLFHRLQGRPFIENYTPTEEIQVACIHWNYKATDDVVKVEVWDVIDKGKKRALAENLKLHQNSDTPLTPALDAEFLDVYKNTNGVILVLDVTKTWTFEYAQKEMEKIPETVPVLILGNHCDMSHHRTVLAEHVSFYAESLNRCTPVRYAEGSMYNGFGLKFLHKWFNLPFLQLQRATLLAQLSTNEREMEVTAEELDLYQLSDDSNYDKFIDRLSIQRRKVAELNSSSSSSAVSVPKSGHALSSVNEPKKQKTPVSKVCDVPKVDKVYGGGMEIVVEKKALMSTVLPERLNKSLKNVEDFIPEESIDRSFLDDAAIMGSGHVGNRCRIELESDEEEEDGSRGNPMVLGLQEDPDSMDEFIFEESTTKLCVNHNFDKEWLRNTELRRSPEGGEAEPLKMPDEEDAQVKEEKSKKEHDKEKKKRKSSKKEKHNKEQQELEDFLNSPLDTSLYEVI